jgi:hypothetical protein
MARARLWTFVPLLVVVGVGGRALLNPVLTRGADRRIIDSRFESVQKEVDYHLFAPTWLPHGGRVGILGTLAGERRVMQDFLTADEQSLCILSQEKRSPDRDAYHHNIFEKRADAQATVNGEPCYFVTGDTGERRMFWKNESTALILSSTLLTDSELVKVATSVR